MSNTSYQITTNTNINNNANRNRKRNMIDLIILDIKFPVELVKKIYVII